MDKFSFSTLSCNLSTGSYFIVVPSRVFFLTWRDVDVDCVLCSSDSCKFKHFSGLTLTWRRALTTQHRPPQRNLQRRQSQPTRLITSSKHYPSAAICCRTLTSSAVNAWISLESMLQDASGYVAELLECGPSWSCLSPVLLTLLFQLLQGRHACRRAGPPICMGTP